jgi:hypothetical protein
MVLEQRARSQLRGSGGVSPRFPNIPLRASIEGGQLFVEARSQEGEIQFVCDVVGDVKNEECRLRV